MEAYNYSLCDLGWFTIVNEVIFDSNLSNNFRDAFIFAFYQLSSKRKPHLIYILMEGGLKRSLEYILKMFLFRSFDKNLAEHF